MLYSSQFDYDRQTKTFSQEISFLGKRVFERIYEDACDEGIIMMSSVTGNIAKFYVFLEEQKYEDLVAWHFVPTPETIKKYPAMKGVKVIIYND